MNRTAFRFLSALTAFLLAFGSHASAGASSGSGDPGDSPAFQGSNIFWENPIPYGQPTTVNWNLVFSDEFSGNALDLNKWRPNWLGPNDASITKPVNSAEVSCYDPKQVAVQNGELNLTAVQRTCLNWNYASGLIESNGKFNFTYGYVESRIWTPAGAGVWPAFWTNGKSWPTDGEIDILEAYGTDRSTFHYHYAGCGGDCGPGGEVNIPGATAGWHVYAADWQPGSITWYYDGQQVWKYTTNIVSVPHYIILNLGLKSGVSALPATMRVDYVRVWKNDGQTPPVTSTPPPDSTPVVTATPVPAEPTASASALPPTSPPESTPVVTATPAPVEPTATVLPPTNPPESTAAITEPPSPTSANPPASSGAPNVTLFPVSLTSGNGSTVGGFASLETQDQQKGSDDPNAYVLFQPQESPYEGYRSFLLPREINPASISNIVLHLNYKGSPSRRQAWTWYVYDWSKNVWVKLGSAKNAQVWKEIRFKLRNPARFISPENEIRIQLRSKTGTGEIRLDYEMLEVRFGTPPAASP